MKYIIYLRDKETEKVHRIEREYKDVDRELVLYMWTEGNYSCDCNRGIFCGLWGVLSPEAKCGDKRFELLSITEEGYGTVYAP